MTAFVLLELTNNKLTGPIPRDLCSPSGDSPLTDLFLGEKPERAVVVHSLRQAAGFSVQVLHLALPCATSCSVLFLVLPVLPYHYAQPRVESCHLAGAFF